LTKTKAAIKMFRHANKILKITHGDEHSLLNESLKPLLYQAIIESQK
jgi:hypothetical protein